MGIAQTLSALALGQLAGGAARAVGLTAGEKAADAVVGFLSNHFRDQSQRLTRALRAANDRAWKALEVALAGDSFWERCSRLVASGEQLGFRAEVRGLLESAGLANGVPFDARACLRELRSARKAGLLDPHEAGPEALARGAGGFGSFDSSQSQPARKSRPFLVMDYFPGQTLEAYVKEHGPLPVDEVLRLARLVAAALKAGHAKGILHRDLKPANLLVRKDDDGWKVKVIDFGLAQRTRAKESTARSARTVAGASIAGTIDYAAPEQMGKLPGVEVGPPSDVYGFGKTCCYALFQTPLPVLKHWQSVPSRSPTC